MYDVLRERILRHLDALPEERLYQVLDYIEFLSSKYAREPVRAPGTPFQRFGERLEDRMRGNRVGLGAHPRHAGGRRHGRPDGLRPGRGRPAAAARGGGRPRSRRCAGLRRASRPRAARSRWTSERGETPSRTADARQRIGGPGAAAPAARLGGRGRAGARAIQRPRLRRRRGRRDRETVRQLIRDLPSFARLLGRLARDPRVSRVDKGIVLATTSATSSMPLDLIPDLLPFLGADRRHLPARAGPRPPAQQRRHRPAPGALGRRRGQPGDGDLRRSTSAGSFLPDAGPSAAAAARSR